MDAQRAMIFRFQEDQELQEKYRSLNEERMELVQRLEQEPPAQNAIRSW